MLLCMFVFVYMCPLAIHLAENAPEHMTSFNIQCGIWRVPFSWLLMMFIMDIPYGHDYHVLVQIGACAVVYQVAWKGWHWFLEVLIPSCERHVLGRRVWLCVRLFVNLEWCVWAVVMKSFCVMVGGVCATCGWFEHRLKTPESFHWEVMWYVQFARLFVWMLVNVYVPQIFMFNEWMDEWMDGTLANWRVHRERLHKDIQNRKRYRLVSLPDDTVALAVVL